jgi:uncharacterized YccA/Bax inhibitor family protein
MFRTSNPTLNRPEFQESGYQSAQKWDDISHTSGTGDFSHEDPRAAGGSGKRPNHMTLSGTTNKTLFLIALTVTTAIIGWNLAIDATTSVGAGGQEVISYDIAGGTAFAAMGGGAIVGLVLAMVTIFKPRFSPVTAPAYALAEGFFVGGISAVYAVLFGGSGGGVVGDPAASDETTQLAVPLVLNAAILTMSIAAALCAAYAFKIVRPGKLFYSATIVGTMGVALFGLVTLLGSLFTGGSGVFGQLASVYDPTNGGVISVGFSLLVVALASANLVLDYDQVNLGIKNRAPRYMEWFGGFTILVTLVWLYIEVLRLLAKLRSE